MTKTKNTPICTLATCRVILGGVVEVRARGRIVKAIQSGSTNDNREVLCETLL